MYDLKPTLGDKPALYRDLLSAIDGVTVDERDAVANMANVAALLMEWLPDLNWAGFYRMVAGGLVLGPFQGKVACIRIAVGTGVCGTAAATGATQIVRDVHAFAGHIPCDGASNSELVVPLMHAGQVIGVIDLDSPLLGRFDSDDAVGIAAIGALLTPRLCADAGQVAFTLI